MFQFKGDTIKAAIFDMDGTLFDTERLRFNTLRQASQELHGTPIGDDILHGSLGLSALKARMLAESRYGDDYPYQAIRQRADELELQHVRQYGVPVKSGLYEVLERLKRNGILMAVATSSRRAIAEEYLLNANVLKYFDITVCGDEVEQGKPHPEIFLTAGRELNCPPEESLMFEDSENGILSASGAGGKVVFLRDIKEPRPPIKALATHRYEGLEGFLHDLLEHTPDLPRPELTAPFPQTLNQHMVGIHGFGAMGGGYLTQIFSHWDGYTRPREILCVSGNQTLRELVNGFGKFNVHYAELAFEQTIDNVRLIDSADADAVCAMYAQAAIVGISLPEGAIRQQAEVIARGLRARWERDGGDLDILVVLNKLGGAAFVRDSVRKALVRQMGEEQAERVLAPIHFTETVVNRIVTKIPMDRVLRQLKIGMAAFEQQQALETQAIEQLSQMPSERAGIQGLGAWIGQGARLTEAWSQLTPALFHSGPDMQLYAAKGSQLLQCLRQIRTVDDIREIQIIKNRLLNGSHAIIAWYASLLGYRTIGQGMGDPRVQELVRQVIEQEVKPAILREQPAMAEFIDNLSLTFINRCKVSFKDPCRRVGRDPLRKLQRKERILGSIALAARHGIPTPALEAGTALGILYALRRGDAADKECRQIRSLYEARGRVGDVLTHSGLYQGKPYQGLDADADRALIERIQARFDGLLTEGLAHEA